jgi:hypothetical protein
MLAPEQLMHHLQTLLTQLQERPDYSAQLAAQAEVGRALAAGLQAVAAGLERLAAAMDKEPRDGE